jgi:hypothetical protein
VLALVVIEVCEKETRGQGANGALPQVQELKRNACIVHECSHAGAGAPGRLPRCGPATALHAGDRCESVS